MLDSFQALHLLLLWPLYPCQDGGMVSRKYDPQWIHRFCGLRATSRGLHVLCVSRGQKEDLLNLRKSVDIWRVWGIERKWDLHIIRRTKETHWKSRVRSHCEFWVCLECEIENVFFTSTVFGNLWNLWDLGLVRCDRCHVLGKWSKTGGDNVEGFIVGFCVDLMCWCYMWLIKARTFSTVADLSSGGSWNQLNISIAFVISQKETT